MNKCVTLRYFASLEERAGITEETLITDLETYRELYGFLAEKYHFALTLDQLRVAVNDEFADLGDTIQEADQIVFIPPVAGG